MIKRLVASALCLALGIGALVLPDPLRTDTDRLRTEQGFEDLPDADLRTIAEQEWEAGRKETAVAILDYIIDEGMGDAPGARVLRARYMQEIADDASPWGRLRAAAWGFATGRVEDGASFAGSTVADLLVYGDVRDLVRELVFEDNTDEIVVALSAAGILTTIFPPAEGAVTVTKALKKASALSEPMIDLLKTRLKGFKNLSEAGMIQRARDCFLPFYELAKQTRSWGTLVALVRHCRDLDQVKLLAKLAAQAPDNGRKLGQILAVAGSRLKKTAEEALQVLSKQGQKGMDHLYAALRKGPAGLAFVAAHPTLTARALKNLKKGTPLGLGHLHDRWGHFMVKYRALAAAIKYGAAWIFFALGAVLGFSALAPGARFAPSIALNWKWAAWAAGASALAVLVVLLFQFLGGMSSIPSPEHATTPIKEGLAMTMNPGTDGAGMAFVLPVILLVNLIIHPVVWRMARARVEEIRGRSVPASEKLALLRNMDIYFDLPMYVGLGLTIFAFVLITLCGAETARLFAYLSTLCGIGVTVGIRFRLQQKAVQEIILSSHEEAQEELTR